MLANGLAQRADVDHHALSLQEVGVDLLQHLVSVTRILVVEHGVKQPLDSIGRHDEVGRANWVDALPGLDLASGREAVDDGRDRAHGQRPQVLLNHVVGQPIDVVLEDDAPAKGRWQSAKCVCHPSVPPVGQSQNKNKKRMGQSKNENKNDFLHSFFSRGASTSALVPRPKWEWE